MGSRVTDTIRKNIVNIDIFTDKPNMLMLGMLCSSFATGIWLLIATKFKLPVSTTHSTIGSIIGFALVAGGINGININSCIKIIISCIISPILSGIITLTFFIFIKYCALNRVNPIKSLFRIFPFMVGITFFINSFFIIYKGTPALGLSNIELWFGLVLSSIIGILFGIFTCIITPHLKKIIINYKQPVIELSTRTTSDPINIEINK